MKTILLSAAVRALLAIRLLCGVVFACSIVCGSEKSPNVVLIVVDDLGWSDLGCYGSDFYDTPNVDQFASQSLKFTSAYAAAPVCSPTRAALMTGKSPARLDMTIWHEGAVDGGPKDRRLRAAAAEPNLPREETTLAELFRNAGYATAHIGKWHLGTAPYYPETQGFDVNIGGTFWGAPATFFYPFMGKWSDNNPEIRYVPGLRSGVRGDYLPDRLTDAALEIIESNQKRPFFLNLWYYTVHSPIEAPKSLVDRYRKKIPGTRHSEPTYAAMVDRMDFNVGRVLDKLVELQLTENTIVVFTSDNGGVDFDQRSIIPTNNAPLRSGKGTLYEGGIRVPLLIRWPQKPIGATNERTISQDLFATFAELLSQTPANSSQDGVSLSALVNDPSGQLPSRSLFWHFPHYYPRMTPGSAIRKGDWKLLHFYEDNRRELYNLRDDQGEQHNVSDMHPNIVNQLYGELDAWRTNVDANSPTKNPEFRN